MEEQPRDRAQDRHYQHHGGDRSSTRHPACVKHDQSHFQCHHQETQTKKTGHENINKEDEGGKSPRLPDSSDMSHPPHSNANRHASAASVKQKSAKLHTTVPKVSSKGLDHQKNMDLKNDKDKILELNNHEGQTLDKKDFFQLQNGVINCGLITNGYSGKDNDGSGSEGGYTTPKKRKARCNNPRSAEHVTREREIQQHTTQEHVAFSLDAVGKGVKPRLEGLRASHKDAQPAGRRTASSDPLVAEPQRKNTDGKTAGTFVKKGEERHKSKLSSPSKEDSWTLFKPPPVFPVDNSSAKIVPKISYASKVKENLNKVAEGGDETLPAPVRLSQVPMSAVKTIASASFSNGSASGPGNGCPVGTFFAPAASSVPPPSTPSGENVASPLEISCRSAGSPADGGAYELRKCTLFIYPLNMQAGLPSAGHLGPAPAQTNQKALGDIFQNQWGLSFINEPSLASDGGGEQLPAEDKPTAAAPRSGRRPDAAAAARPCFRVGPSFLEPDTLVQDLERRICVKACSPAPGLAEEERKNLQEQTQAEAKSPGHAGSSRGRDSRVQPALAPLGTLCFGSSNDCGRTCSWGSFDMKAAVAYHTKEMEFIFNLQKQDPKRVVFYKESLDGPDQ
ncbi:unnamed protein product [Tetraodon nigroviridis]|uniref:(spotted green pufferfish) hypothetical protein n=1 Tax=Tetraodon nigroviridis TaxID=99883 RepID=Q4S8P6_TETNG|nr:unnamed protein product [Tetraodon nigroviridis]